MPTISPTAPNTQDTSGTISTAPIETTRQTDTSVGAETPTEATPKTQEDSQLSNKFAALSRKERALRSRSKELEAKEQAIKAQETEYQQAKALRERLTQNPLEVLNELGITYEQLVNQVMNQPNPEYSKLENEIKELKAAQTEAQQRQTEAQQKAYEQAVNQLRTDVKSIVASDSSFETIKELGQEEAVLELITETFNSDGVLLTIEDAASQVEEYLVEEAMRMAQLKKIKSKLTPQEAPKPQVTEKQQTTPLKTLTNAATQSPSKRLTEKERMERAILAFKGQLK